MEAGISLLQWCLGQDSGYVAIGAKHARTRAWKETFFPYPGDISELKNYIVTRSRNSDIYFCPTLLRAPKRIKDNISLSSVLWADLDSCPPSLMLIEPTIVVETSLNRYQAFWGLENPEPALDVEEYNRRIAYRHRDEGCDPSGWDLTQYLRVPGTKNFKPDRPIDTEVKVISSEWGRKYTLSDFDVYEPVPGMSNIDVPFDIGEDARTAEEILNSAQMQMSLNPNARDLYELVPLGKSWSESLWSLELYLFNAGLGPEDVFIVCREAACNKYARDGRPDEHLWKEVIRAQAHVNFQEVAPSIEDNTIKTENIDKVYIPRRHILDDAERSRAHKRKTIVDEYIEWGKSCTDAPEQYHEAGAFIVLSALLAGQICVPTSGGQLIPNLWFMTLGESTLSRKSTCIGLARTIIEDVDSDAVLATDGSVEGIMDALAGRPKRPSIFLKDEFSGFLEAMVKKDYMGGAMEHFTQLYDGQNLKRMLRSGPISINKPIFILYGGGIPDRIYSWLTPDHIASGFVPRFCFISPKIDMTKIRPLGPATPQNLRMQAAIVDRFRAIYAHYAAAVDIDPDSGVVVFQKTWNAELTPGAWERYNSIANVMESMALKSDITELLLPMMDRLAKSGLKIAVLIAAAERLDEKIVVHRTDIVSAFRYIESWIEYSFNVVTNAGKSVQEKGLERIADYVLANPGTSRGRVMQRFHLSAREADGTFATLIQRGLVTCQKQGAKQVFYPVRSIKSLDDEAKT